MYVRCINENKFANTDLKFESIFDVFLNEESNQRRKSFNQIISQQEKIKFIDILEYSFRENLKLIK